MKRSKPIFIFMAILLVVNMISGYIIFNNNVQDVSYLTFMDEIAEGNVSKVSIQEGESTLRFVDKDGNSYKTDNPKTEGFRESLLLEGIKVEDISTVNYYKVLLVILVVLMILFIAGFLLPLLMGFKEFLNASKGGGVNSRPMGQMHPGQKEQAVQSSKVDVTFDDLQGCNEVKKDMEFVVNFLQNPKLYHEMGARMPKGIVLYGPPGTGKTLTARAIAGTAGVPFFSVSGSDFMEKYVGVGAKRVRDLYKQAKANAPCIVFIDEIDAIGKKRGANSNDEKDQTINALLTELDGFSGIEGVITICATNRVELLDDALVRPGRFDKHVAVPLPEKEDRLAILKLHAKNKKLSNSVDLQTVASMTVGFSGAGLEALLNESAFIAVNENKESITMEEVDRAFYRHVMKGDRKENLTGRDHEELELVAWHEAGHALVTKLLTNDEVSKVTVIPSTSGAGGVTFRVPEKASLYSKSYLEKLIKVMYGGRVAELMLFGDEDKITTGASSDIKQATSLIKDYITTYGMSEKYGMINVGVFTGNPNLHQENLLEEATVFSNKIYDETVKILTENKDTLEAIALALIERESLSNSELDEIINRNCSDNLDDSSVELEAESI